MVSVGTRVRLCSWGNPNNRVISGTLALQVSGITSSDNAYDDIQLELTLDDVNTVYANITVEVTPADAPALPDPAVSAGDIHLLGYTTDEDTITIGATIHNYGHLPADDVQVEFYE